MTYLESRAMALQVVGFVSTMQLDHKLVLFLRYGEIAERATMEYILIGAVPQQYGIDGARVAVRKWFDQDGRVGIRDIADKINRSCEPAHRYFKSVAAVLDLILSAAHERIEQRYPDLIEKKSDDDEELTRRPKRRQTKNANQACCV